MTRYLVYGNLTTRRMADPTGSPVALPTFVQGGQYEIAFRLLDDSITGSPIPTELPIRALTASIGLVNTPPTTGYFTLQFGSSGEPSVRLRFDVDSATLQQELELMLSESGDWGGTLKDITSPTPGCWLIRFNWVGEVPLIVHTNRLSPVSFIRISAFQENGEWVHELRLIQAPYVSTAEFERQLPPEPSVREIIAGQVVSDGLVTTLVNEVQALTVPGGFNSTYALNFKGAPTPLLAPNADVATIAAALNTLIVPQSDGNFLVTNPEPFNAYIEFAGKTMTGIQQDLLTITIGTVGLGDSTFVLDFNTTEVAAALRTRSLVTAVFELKLTVGTGTDTPENPDIDDNPSREITLWQEIVTIRPALQWPGMAVAAPVNWLTPPQPKDYIPYSDDEILFTELAYSTSFGSTTTASYNFVHNFGTREIIGPTVRRTADNQHVLVLGTDYNFTINSGNDVTIGLTTTPSSNLGLHVAFCAAVDRNVFDAHHHTIAEIDGLLVALGSLTSAVSALQISLPSSGFGSGNFDPDSVVSFDFGSPSEILFAGSALTLNSLPARGLPFLLPAIHTATFDELPDSTGPLPVPADNVNVIWQNQEVEPVRLIPGGGKIRASIVPYNGFVGSDGRILAPYTRSGTSKSYFPTPFERQLFSIAINDKMLSVDKSFESKFAVGLQLVNANCRGQWVLVIEHGVANFDSTSGYNPDNVSTVTWNATPILSQRIVLDPTLITHSFGVRIRRTSLAMFADKMLYGIWSGSTSIPATANFILRARLIEFDTENSIAGRGWLYYQLTDVTGTGHAIAEVH